MRVGLVFEGGGTRGAFAFGAARALVRAGVPIAAVAGTSVGALNAVLVGTGQIELGSRLWASITEDSIFGSTLPRSIGYLLLLVILAPCHAYSRWIRGLAPWHAPERSLVNLVLRVIFMNVHMLPLLVITIDMNSIGGYIAYCLFAAGPLLVVAHKNPVMSHALENTYRYVLVVLGAFAVVTIILLAGFFFIRWLLGLSEFGIVYLALGVIAFLSAWLFLLLAMLIIGEGFAAFTPVPLQKLVKECIAKNFSIPTYATVATRKNVFDPDNPSYHPLFKGEEGFDFNSDTRSVYVPKYMDLPSLAREEIERAIIASASLPFGIVKSIEIDNDECADGGLADNTPLLPLILRGDLDLLVVIHLTRPAIPVDEVLRCRQLLRLEEVQKFPCPDHIFDDWDKRPYRGSDPPTVIPLPPLVSVPQIIHIWPPTKLGSVLNFRRSHIQDLLSKGERAAQELIEKNSYLLAAHITKGANAPEAVHD